MGRGALATPARSIKARAIQLLARREHSRAELRRKLLPHALAEDAQARDVPEADAGARVDALLDWLEANHHLSQQRFVESRVHARASRFGNLRIQQELAQHKVSLPAEDASALKGTEYARAQEVWQRKFGAPPASPADHAKQARFLAGRGFSGDVVHRVLRNASAVAAGEDMSAGTGSGCPER